MPVILYVLLVFSSLPVVQESSETSISGVFQGRTLFIQNPYDPIERSFCIKSVRINNREIGINTNLSAVKLDFKNVDLYTPIMVKIIHADSCTPLVINPDAIIYHSTFSFEKIALTDSVLSWSTTGEHEDGSYVIEQIETGIWMEQDTIPSKGVFGGSEYNYYPLLGNGPNKIRVKYTYPNGEYLYSRDVDFHYYPEEVTFKPKATATKLFLSRSAEYKIYDGGGAMVMSGRGIEIDVTTLPEGEYIVYFDEEYPGVFRKK